MPNPVTGHHNAPCGSCFARLPFSTLLQEIEIRIAANWMLAPLPPHAGTKAPKKYGTVVELELPVFFIIIEYS